MADVVAMRERAQEIADRALRTQRGGNAQAALIDTLMATLVSEGLAAQEKRNGREIMGFERDFEKVALLIDALREGNYRDTAARLAGISASGVRAWVKAGDDGDPRYRTFSLLVQFAEAIAEAECVSVVRNAGKSDPRLWASSATYLERKHPDRWGRRSEDASAPKVIVQIGVRDSDVQVQIAAPAAVSLPPSVIDIPPSEDLD